MRRWSLIVGAAILLAQPLSVSAQGGGAPGVAKPVTDSVWVNTSSGVYHCPGTRYYGATLRGRYLAEAEARQGGFRPAYGKVCTAAVTAPLASVGRDRATGVRVWVNTSSRVYHCPGTRYYGNTRQGRYMPEVDARAAGNRPAGGKSCS